MSQQDKVCKALPKDAVIVSSTPMAGQNQFVSQPVSVIHVKVTPKTDGSWLIYSINLAAPERSHLVEEGEQNINFFFDYGDEQPNIVERFESAILVCSMDNSADQGSYWQFHGSGIVFDNDPNNIRARVRTRLHNQGQQLIITIDRVQPNISSETNPYDSLPFRFLASRMQTGYSAGKVELYNSQDPSVGVGSNGGTPP